MRWMICIAMLLPCLAQADEPAAVCIWADRTPASDRIEQVLDAPLSSQGLEFTETPLGDVVAYLREEYAIEIQIDNGALDELGFAPDEPITVNVKNVSLRSALTLLLRDLDLGYVIDNEVLLLTSLESSIREGTAVYPVADLLPDEPIENLVDTIIGVAPKALGDGTPGRVSTFGDHCIVVTTSSDVHLKIAGLLTALRKSQAGAAATPAAAVPPDSGSDDPFGGKEEVRKGEPVPALRTGGGGFGTSATEDRPFE